MGWIQYFLSPLDSVVQAFVVIEEYIQGDQQEDPRDDEEAGAEQKPDPPKTSEDHVALNTIVTFAKIDAWSVELAWHVSGEGELAASDLERVKRDALEIKQHVEESGRARDLQDVVAKARAAGEKFSELTESLEPGDVLQPEPAASVDHSKSKLDAQVLIQDRLRKCLHALFNALVRQLTCCDQKHFGRLQLTGFVSQCYISSPPAFDLYLSSRYDWKPCRWLESKCTITQTPLRRSEQPSCDILKKSEQKRKNLDLLLEEQQWEVKATQQTTGAVQLGRCVSPKSPATPKVSLWELLRPERSGDGGGKRAEFYPLYNVKDRLCLSLALSLLQLSSDEWRAVRWRSDKDTSIFFLRDPATQGILEPTFPYLSWRIHYVPEDEEGYESLLCDAQLLDFGQLLVEIMTWSRLPADVESSRARSKEEFRKKLLIHVNKIFSHREVNLTNAIRACLNISGRRDFRDASNPRALQEYIFQKIVLQLEANCNYPEQLKSESGSHDEKGAASEDETAVPIPVSLYDNRVDYNEPHDKSSDADGFISKIQNFAASHISALRCPDNGPLPQKLPRKIRIAVIDSGVRDDDARILGWRAGRNRKIRECRSFTGARYTDNHQDWHDRIGHGTMVACLLLDVAPEAELYIAKVTEGEKIPKTKLYQIADAINWAVQLWQVDIITMSIALLEPHTDINAELDKALDPSFREAKAKIVFAAAGNKGLTEDRAWPARKSGVIAVHAADWLGAASNINPPREKGTVHFATLGRDIRMKWLEDAQNDRWGYRYISGTSFATPIAAGMAANVLEFASHKLDLTSTQRDRLFSHDGIKKIFKAMSVYDDKFYYIQPWKLWSAAYKGDWGNKEELCLFPDDPDNICQVLDFLIGKAE